MKNRLVAFLTLVIISCIFSAAQAGVIDTTKVRTTEKVRKTTGEIISDIPGEIIKTPFYILDFAIEKISLNPPLKQVYSWIGTPQKPTFIMPVLGYNSSAGFKFGIGFKFKNLYTQNDYLKTKFYYSTNNYQSYQIKTGSPDLMADEIGFDLYFRYNTRTREDFYGLSNRSLTDLIANYHLEKTEFKFRLLYNRLEKTYIGFALGYLSNNLYDGEDPDYPGNLDSIAAYDGYLLNEGSLDNSRFFTYGVTLEFDHRDSPAQPKKGFHLLSELKRYHGVDFSEDLKFSKYTVDLRQYTHLWRKRVLAIRFAAGRLNANRHNPKAAPIYILSQLGGEEYLRGFSKGRFMDNDFALFSVEYRYPIHDFLDMFLFYDQARVYHNITNEVFFTDWKSAFGGGIRVWESEGVRGIIQIAKSKEATKFYFDMEAVW